MTRPSPLPRLLLLAPLLLLALPSCRRDLPAPDAIATLGDREYRYEEFEAHVRASLGESGESLTGAALSRLLDQFLAEELLRRLAAERGLAEPTASGDAAAEALLTEAAEMAISEAEVERYYADHRAELARPERVRLRQVLVRDRATAQQALAGLAAGEDFAAVARRLSIDPSAAGGGEQGELGREDLPSAFADVIFALAPGEVSPIVAADYGFHLFQVVSRRPAETPPLAAVAPEIRDRLARERAGAALERLVGEAKAQYNAAVHETNLPFTYVGSFP